MLSSIKYLFKPISYYIFGVPVLSCLFVAAYFYLFGANTHNGEYISGMVFAVISMLSFAVCMNFYSCYGNIALSMGATRKGFFAASQIIKIAVCTAMAISSVLANATLNYFYQINFFENSKSFIILFGLSIILGTIGESIGIVCSRWGRIGMVIYIGICVLFGGAVGAFMVVGTDVFFSILAFILQSVWLSLGAMLLFSALITLINGILYKKSVVI